MAVMDAAIFQALWRHTTQIKYAKPIIKDFKNIFATYFYRFFNSSDKQSFSY